MRTDTQSSGSRPKPFPWNVVVGLACIGVSLAYMLDPDYPLAWTELGDSSPFRVSELAPRMESIGEDLEFRWRWDGEPAVDRWTLIVQDESFRPIYRSEPIDAGNHAATTELRALLRPGGRFHACVEAVDAPDLRSSCVAFDVR